ncbi:MAG: hypothetical protein V4710_13630 [Verrucomicrobiota bacterium]
MNTPPASPSPVSSVSCPLSPVSRIHRLAARALAAFPECTLSWSLVVEWCREHLLLQRRWSREALAIDDEMERVAPDLADCLRNDPPAKRRKIWVAWKETHRRTRALAEHLQP